MTSAGHAKQLAYTVRADCAEPAFQSSNTFGRLRACKAEPAFHTATHMTGAGHAKQQAHTVRPDRAEPAFLTLWYLTTAQRLLNSKDSPLAYNSTDRCTQHHNIKHCCWAATGEVKGNSHAGRIPWQATCHRPGAWHWSQHYQGNLCKG